MKVGAGPGSLSKPDPKRLETAFQRFPLMLLYQFGWSLGRESLQITANEPRQRGLPLHRDLTHFFDKLIVERKRYIHGPIIREPLIVCNVACSLPSCQLEPKIDIHGPSRMRQRPAGNEIGAGLSVSADSFECDPAG
jgi:hypothetical protein